MSDPKPMHDEDDLTLRDPVLRRALEHAPDQAAAPDARLSESIRTLAHEAVAPSLPALPVAGARPWWQRLLGIGAGGGGMPWNAAFATVLVGVLVTVMWQREEAPGARSDGAAAPPPPAVVAQGVPAPVPAAAPAVPPAPAAAPAVPSALDAQLAESRATTAAATRALDQEEARVQREQRQADSDAAAARARAQARKETVRPASPQPVAPAPVLPEPPAAPAAANAPLARANKQAPVAERRSLEAQPESPLPLAAPRAAAAPPPATAAAAGPSAPPSFAALSQWTLLHITRPDGETRSLPRAEARELGALIGSAALAGVSARPLRGKVDWRITLERNGEALGVLELAGGQVRWREDGVPPGTGSPGAGAMKGLRAALEEASAASSAPAR